MAVCPAGPPTNVGVGVRVAVGVAVRVGVISRVAVGVSVAIKGRIVGIMSAASGQLSNQDWISAISMGWTTGRMFGSVEMIF